MGITSDFYDETVTTCDREYKIYNMRIFDDDIVGLAFVSEKYNKIKVVKINTLSREVLWCIELNGSEYMATFSKSGGRVVISRKDGGDIDVYNGRDGNHISHIKYNSEEIKSRFSTFGYPVFSDDDENIIIRSLPSNDNTHRYVYMLDMLSGTVVQELKISREIFKTAVFEEWGECNIVGFSHGKITFRGYTQPCVWDHDYIISENKFDDKPVIIDDVVDYNDYRDNIRKYITQHGFGDGGKFHMEIVRSSRKFRISAMKDSSAYWSLTRYIFIERLSTNDDVYMFRIPPMHLESYECVISDDMSYLISYDDRNVVVRINLDNLISRVSPLQDE